MSSQEYDREFENENPLVVEDDQHSTRPFTDRETLTNVLTSLAAKFFEALQKDRESNKRYATRIVISNRLKHDSHSSPTKGKKYGREEFEVKLPLRFEFWNDLDQDDIEIELFRNVVRIHDQYRWYKVRVRATHFIGEQTRETLEKMEAEDVSEASHAAQPTAKPDPAPTNASTVPNPKQEQQQTANQPLESSESNNQILKDVNSRISNDLNLDDDDEDIMIVYETHKN